MKTNSTQIAACIFVLLATGLLIGLRLDAIWAGGDGIAALDASIFTVTGEVSIQHDDELRVVTEGSYDESLSRGEIIKTGEGSLAGMSFGDDVDLNLDENTDIEIIQLSTNTIEITVHRGRLIIDSDHQEVLINGKHSQWILKDGAVTAVNYDFLEVMAVAIAPDPESITEAYLLWENGSLPIKKAFSVNETLPLEYEETDFNFDLDFYK
jgi:hypothetical protein